MDTSITYAPLMWRYFAEDDAWYIVRERPDCAITTQKVYGPFDEDEAKHAGEIWGVSFKPEGGSAEFKKEMTK